MSQEPTQTGAEERENSPQSPPEELKPWYYQYWFLYPMIVFWPLWSVLIIRSPWHNGLVSGSLAWALLIIGGYLGWLRMQEGGTVALSTVAIVAPGLIFTVITQVHWIINRRRIMEVAAGYKEQHSAAEPEPPPRARSRRGRRRRPRQR